MEDEQVHVAAVEEDHGEVAVMPTAASHGDDDDDEDAVDSLAEEAEDPAVEGIAEVQALEVDDTAVAGADDEEEVVLAAVVVDDDGDNNDSEEEELSVAEPVHVVSEPPIKKQKTAPSSVPIVAKKSAASNAATSGPAAKKKGGTTTVARKRPPPKKKAVKSDAASRMNGGGDVPPARLRAAHDARAQLKRSILSLPASIGDAQVRAFGKIQLPTPHKENPFAANRALYPVGFSLDKYDFSIVHGRTLKLRCSILDGGRISRQQKDSGCQLDPDEPKLHEGPVFRVMWGRGIDEDDMDEYSYDPLLHSAADSSNGSTTTHAMGQQATPVEDMRVKVRFDKNQYYMGTIVKVENFVDGKHKPTNKENTTISIRYDDGSFEASAPYPDPDIELVLPGTDPDIDSTGNVELRELNGKPVTSAVGNTPIEAWGRALIKLGMIDEVMFDSGLMELENLRTKMSLSGGDARKSLGSGGETPTNGAGPHMSDPDRDPPSEKEKFLRKEVSELIEELEEALEDDKKVQKSLFETRIAELGPFLANPFSIPEAQQQTWLSIAIRREKARLGNTGNKKKVMTAPHMLEKNDTIFNNEIRNLVEGLPGTENCTTYCYQAHRGKAGEKAAAAVAKAVVQEAKKEVKKRVEVDPKKKAKQAKLAEAKASEELAKQQKKREREEERDEKKRQKMEEEEQKRQARISERMARLRMQVDDRLYKEVAVQRERVIMNLARSLAKEYMRRRKAAEVVSAQSILESYRAKSLFNVGAANTDPKPLPTISKTYGEQIVRIWDFVSTFGDFFQKRGFVPEVPTLDSLQSSLDCLTGKQVTAMSRNDAVTSLTSLALALCKPLAPSLTRVLFASLIALNPMLQKEYGAAFFNDMSSVEPLKEEDEIKANVLLPVNDLTWQEIARLAFISDALGELGLQRHEVAHILRGYRSAGHPNSKEAQRLRKIEGITVESLKQEIHEAKHPRPRNVGGPIVRMSVPCDPICDQTSPWFFLHACLALGQGDDDVEVLLENLNKAVDMISNDRQMKGLHTELLSTIETLQQVQNPQQPTKPELKTIRKALRHLSNVFAKHGGNHLSAKERFTSEDGKWPWQVDQSHHEIARQQMGLLKALSLTPQDYNKLKHKRELYMEDALRMKEEMEREKSAEGEDEEEYDDDDEEEAENKAQVIGDEEAKDAEKKPAGEDASPGTVGKIGKETPYDEFCADVPEAPELIRRCLAVLRALVLTSPAEPFIYPVDPQTNPGYYDMVLQPMCFREVGKQLLVFANDKTSEKAVETAVLEFGRNVRLINQNCLSYANAGPMVIAAGAEMVKIFERLFFDWVLAPSHLLPLLDALDDDKCVDHHESDEQSTVLVCDGCEGKFNIQRLNPPLKDIPKGDWYCPRCVTGRWWGNLDPRVGKEVQRKPSATPGKIARCLFRYTEQDSSSPNLIYEIHFPGKQVEFWSLEDINGALSAAGEDVPPIRCLEAVSESPGYGIGLDHGNRLDLVPIPVHPCISDAAARSAISSSVFRDTVAAAATLLLIDPKDMTAVEWLRLLDLLVTKCAASDQMQNVINQMEGAAADEMTPKIDGLGKVTDIKTAVADVELDDDGPPDGGGNESINSADAARETEAATSNGSNTKEGPKDAVMVDAAAVEVVEDVDAAMADAAPKSAPLPLPNGSSPPVVASATLIPALIPTEERDIFKEALAEKSKRQKVYEDLFSGQAIKNQIKTAVATFGEDSVSPVVDSALGGQDTGLDFGSLRNRRITCAFCGLPDQALGSPLVRVPENDEWKSLIPYGVANRRTHLVAEMPSSNVGEGNNLVAVRIRLDGDIVSCPEPDLEKTVDGGMLEFVPRAEHAFQNELRWRYNKNLPFITGKLSAHECCAIAAHNARKDQLLLEFREKQAELFERDAGTACGRTLEIGRDQTGRAYWKFKADEKSLFVTDADGKNNEWSRFGDAASVASVICALGKDPVVRHLKRIFPEAAQYVKDGSWRSRVFTSRFPKVAEILSERKLDEDSSARETKEVLVEGGYDAYHEGEDVLVESKNKLRIWDGRILDVSRRKRGEPIDAYKVQYTGWSGRFVEWVHPSRVVEPSDHNRSYQSDLEHEMAKTRANLPPALNFLIAKDYAIAADRARGNQALPDLAQIAWTDASLSTSEATIGLMKAAMLVIEAALPVGSVQNTESGVWRNDYAKEWRLMVRRARGAAELMKLLIFLEDCIYTSASSDWIKEDVSHITGCMPNRWKAVGEASASGLAVRITLLDRSIKYAEYDRKRYSKRKRRRL